ncbi:putative S-adenosyl-L-methionine-dependent methyltransferase, Methyltransferase domain 25 [Septoria linicola]|nr:putative S-adenosyl-L-methionine-dependent methyltransferase, Methyltransferase domain 25 [Septoria linicola]
MALEYGTQLESFAACQLKYSDKSITFAMTDQSSKWSATAQAYSSKIVEVTSQGGQALLELINTIDPPKGTSVVLDSGAGTGLLTSLLADQYPGVQTTAADYAPAMLEILKQKKVPNVQTIVVDAGKDHVAQGLEADSYSHALSTFMMFRVLKPGGIIGIAIWSKNLIGEPWDVACKKLDPEYTPSDLPFARTMKSLEDLEMAYVDAGFVDVSSRETEMYLEFESGKAFADYFLDSKNPPFISIQRAWRGDVEDVRDELARVTTEHYGDGKIYMVAACSVGRKPA